MLHFPSKNTAAHRPDPLDVNRLHQLMGHHVWAFSNFRVDAPGLPVAEVDWLFYNSLRGTFVLSEWKRFPARVLQVMDEGKPWTLTSGMTVPNPVEQVGRQLQAVRRVLRQDICRQFFPSVDQHSLNLYPSVYSPQIDESTRRERLRYGAVHGSLEEVAHLVERRAVTAPLLVSGASARLELAETLTDLFRCSIGTAVRRKLDPPAPVPPDPAVRMAAIHRELAALHVEMASLLETPVPVALPTPIMTPAPVPVPAPIAASTQVSAPLPSRNSETPPQSPAKATRPSPPVAVTKAAKASAAGHLKGHVTRIVPASRPTSEHLRNAFLAALQDSQLKRSGVHIGLFGSFVGQHLTGEVKLADLAPGGLGKWCQAQAQAAGVPIIRDPHDPSIIKLTRATDPQKEAV
ncbi:nuclease-related domain-containing protein [Arthrobacter sp. TMS2-4]